ncbi:MAG: AI-2E family transporter [Elainellaceae cyanobacterium]
MKLGDWLGILCLLMALFILWQIRQMLLLVFTAVVLATALNSLARQIQRLRIGRSLAVVLTLILVIFVAVLFTALIVPSFIEQFRRLLQLLPIGIQEIVNRVEQIIENPPAWFPELRLEVPNLSTLPQQLQPLIRNLLQNFFAFFSNSLTVLLKILLVVALTLMLIANPKTYRDAMIRLFPSFYRRRADVILTECEVALGNWLGGILINSIFVALMSGIGLWIMQIDLLLVHALLAGLLNFIPNIGPALSVVFPLSVALLGPIWKAIPIVILYIVIQNLESYWVSPMVMARQVSLLPAITLSAQVFFASFFGFLGLVLALPLTVVAKVWIEEALIRDVLDRWEYADFHKMKSRESLVDQAD